MMKTLHTARYIDSVPIYRFLDPTPLLVYAVVTTLGSLGTDALQFQFDRFQLTWAQIITIQRFTYVFRSKLLNNPEKTLHSNKFFTIRWMSKWRRTWKLFVPMPRIGKKWPVIK